MTLCKYKARPHWCVHPDQGAGQGAHQDQKRKSQNIAVWVLVTTWTDNHAKNCATHSPCLRKLHSSTIALAAFEVIQAAPV